MQKNAMSSASKRTESFEQFFKLDSQDLAPGN